MAYERRVHHARLWNILGYRDRWQNEVNPLLIASLSFRHKAGLHDGWLWLAWA